MGCHFLLQGIFPTQGSNPQLWQVDALMTFSLSPNTAISLFSVSTTLANWTWPQGYWPQTSENFNKSEVFGPESVEGPRGLALLTVGRDPWMVSKLLRGAQRGNERYKCSKAKCCILQERLGSEEPAVVACVDFQPQPCLWEAGVTISQEHKTVTAQAPL